MKDRFISFLKNDVEVSVWVWYGILLVVFLVVLKSVLRGTKINPKIFDYSITLTCLLLLLITVAGALLIQNYNRLWTMVFILAVAVLQKVIPKFTKWYDDKVDALSEKL